MPTTAQQAPAAIDLPLVRIEKPRLLTYLGSRVIITVEHHDKKRDGLRTITRKWIDEADPRNGGWGAGSITKQTVEGDGQTNAFRVIHPETSIA